MRTGWSRGIKTSRSQLGEGFDVEGFGPWSTKRGVIHVQPPPSVLGQMMAVRIYLDACSTNNGCLRVIPGSHNSGVLPPDELSTVVRRGPVVSVAASLGDAVVIKPLIVHSSKRSETQNPRRVLHIEFAREPLPGGLEWQPC